MARPWSSTTAEVLQAHGVGLAKGLTTAQVTRLRTEHGLNELDKEEGTPLWKLVLQQFDDLVRGPAIGFGAASSAQAPAHSAPWPLGCLLAARQDPARRSHPVVCARLLRGRRGGHAYAIIVMLARALVAGSCRRLMSPPCLLCALLFAEAFVEPFVILLILVINAIVGVWQARSALLVK